MVAVRKLLEHQQYMDLAVGEDLARRPIVEQDKTRIEPLAERRAQYRDDLAEPDSDRSRISPATQADSGKDDSTGS